MNCDTVIYKINSVYMFCPHENFLYRSSNTFGIRTDKQTVKHIIQSYTLGGSFTTCLHRRLYKLHTLLYIAIVPRRACTYLYAASHPSAYSLIVGIRSAAVMRKHIFDLATNQLVSISRCWTIESNRKRFNPRAACLILLTKDCD